MKLVGLKRVKEVYGVWFFIFLVLGGIMLFLEIKIPVILFWMIIIFLIKDILFDYEIINIQRPRAYWAEHAPLSLLIFIIGILGVFGVDFFSGYVNFPTIFLAAISFILDFYKDLTEDPSVYKKKSM